jgi:hypothetical protein
MSSASVPRSTRSRLARLASPLPLLVLFVGSLHAALAQVPPDCPNVCDQKYALCIAASCDPKTGLCGSCDKTDGSCGYCYVLEGKSCSYGTACSTLQPTGSTVYSTYSERLSADFGFKVLSCDSSPQSADCMDGKCTLTGKTVTLTDKAGHAVTIPTAICQCKVNGGGGATLGGQCNAAHCSATWSVAGGVLQKLPHCP